MSLPVECQGIQDEIESLQRELQSLQQELVDAAPGDKPVIIRQIRAVSSQIAKLSRQLESCTAEPHPIPNPTPPPLEAVFTGVATVTTTYGPAPGPFVEPTRFTVTLNGERTVIALTSFPSISTQPFDTPFGLNVTTVRRTDGGIGSYANGRIAMPLTLRFDQSIDLPFYEEDSILTLRLTTEPPGSPVNPGPFGRVALAGSGTFVGGILGGSTGTLVVRGSLAPPVPTTVPDVRELRRTPAINLVHAAGLETRLVGALHAPNAWVYSQSPAAETTVFRGSTVTLNLKSEPIP